MRTIESRSKTYNNGHIKLDYPLGQFASNVRVFILLDDKPSESEEEKLWVVSINENPAFNFLNDQEENIYSLNEGGPIND